MASFIKIFGTANNAKDCNKILSKLKEEINHATEFIQQIEVGELDATYPELDDASSNLSKALVSMRDHLKKISETDNQRKWVADSLSIFEDIIRSNHSNLEDFCYEIILNVAKHVKVNQGSIYVLDDENKNLDLKACYAYERKKHVEQSFEIGEGLVGQTFLEKETVLLEEIPENYITITSGLGSAEPNTIIIIPLKFNNDVVGIMELASFHKFLQHQVEFLEKLSESIASAISNFLVTERTHQLLTKSQKQADDLSKQEDELRKNMQELSSTQDQMKQLLEKSQAQEQFMNNLINSTTDIVYTIDENYQLVHFNDAYYKYCKKLGEPPKIGAKAKDFLGECKEETQKDWLRALQGETFEKTEFNKSTSTYYLSTYTPLKYLDGKIHACAVFSKNITELALSQQRVVELLNESKEQSELLRKNEQQLNEYVHDLKDMHDEMKQQLSLTNIINYELDARMAVLNESTIVSEADIYGNIIFINDKFCKVSQFTRDELIDKPHSIIRHPSTPKKFFSKLWATIKSGNVFRGFLKNRKKDGSAYYVDLTISPILDNDNKPIKYIAARYVIEDETFGEKLIEEQNRHLLSD